MDILADELKAGMDRPTEMLAYLDGQLIARIVEDARKFRLYVFADYYRVNGLATQKVEGRYLVSDWVASRYGKKDFMAQLIASKES